MMWTGPNHGREIQSIRNCYAGRYRIHAVRRCKPDFRMEIVYILPHAAHGPYRQRGKIREVLEQPESSVLSVVSYKTTSIAASLMGPRTFQKFVRVYFTWHIIGW